MRVQGRAVGVDSAQAHPSAMSTLGQLFGQAVWHQHHGKPNEAAKLYKQVLVLQPDHAEACNNLACLLLAQGKRDAASRYFERALILLPQLFDDFDSVVEMLVAVNPRLGEGMKRAASAWPRRLPTRELSGSSFAAIYADALLRHVLESTTIRNVDLERLLTSLRAEFLRLTADGGAIRTLDDNAVAFCCALAKQCFINEYVFAVTEHAERLRQKLVEALAQDSTISAIWPCVVAMYFPLHLLPNAQALLDRAWPPALTEVVTQQVREPWEERQYRDLIPRLTPIDDDVSVQVKKQYEENPYPRWVHAASVAEPTTLDEHLRHQFPSAPFHPLGNGTGIDILVAGCGTGRHSIELARKYRVRVARQPVASLFEDPPRRPSDVIAQRLGRTSDHPGVRVGSENTQERLVQTRLALPLRKLHTDEERLAQVRVRLCGQDGNHEVDCLLAASELPHFRTPCSGVLGREVPFGVGPDFLREWGEKGAGRSCSCRIDLGGECQHHHAQERRRGDRAPPRHRHWSGLR